MSEIPNPTIAASRDIGTTAFIGDHVGNFNVIAPTNPAQYTTAATSQRKRIFGLVPALAGATLVMVEREPPRMKVTPRDLSQARADLRRAKAHAQVAEAAFVAAVGVSAKIDPNNDAHTKAMATTRDAADLVAALTRKVGEIEAALVQRPIGTRLAPVREPAEVADQVKANGAVYVCQHEGCQHETWTDEAAMRRAHPTAAEMERKQACHVFVLKCDAPLDPLDPDGPKVGFVAPIGRDGSTVKAAIADAEEADERDAVIADLTARLAQMEKALAALTPAAKK